MLQLIVIFIPILAADVVNPVLLAAQMYAMGSDKPIMKTWFVLLGWFAVYFISGIVLAIGFESISEFIANPRPIDFYIEIIVAALLIWFGIRFLFKKPDPKKKSYDETSKLSNWGAFILGASINLIGLPFAIPYFAALDQVLKANLGWTESLVALLIYNLLYILPFATILFLKIIMGEKAAPILEKINLWMDKISRILLPGMMILIGIVLIIDSFLFFTTEKPLF
jgi:threonine/homoserine/homoserine lactone efflux protein